MKGTIVGLFLAIFFLYFVASRFGLVSVSYSLNSTLRQIPNAHWSSSFSSIYQLKLKLDSCENRTRLALHRRLGPVVRIAPQELSVNIIEGGVSTIFGLKYFDRSEFYKRAFRQNDDVPYMLTFTKRREHSVRRKMLTAPYTKSSISRSSSVDQAITSSYAVLKQQIDAAASTNTPLDILERSRSCFMDMTTAWIYGPERGTAFVQEPDTAAAYFADFKRSGFNAWWSDFPETMAFLERFKLCTPPVEVRNARRALIARNRASVTQAQNDEKTICGSFCVLLRRAGYQGQHLIESAAVELQDHTVASHDNGGTVIAYALDELSRHPGILQRLREEIKQRTSILDTDHMPLLDAVFTETLRLRSPGPGPWSRVAPVGGCTIGGYENIPEGTVLSATSWTLHRNPEVFPNPDEWLPERWLGKDEAQQRTLRKWFWAFGSGPMGCIGKHFAERTVKAVLAGLIADFDYEVVDNSGMEQVDAIIAGPVGDRLILQFHKAS